MYCVKFAIADKLLKSSLAGNATVKSPNAVAEDQTKEISLRVRAIIASGESEGWWAVGCVWETGVGRNRSATVV